MSGGNTDQRSGFTRIERLMVIAIIAVLAALVEDALRRAALWDEVKDKLDRPGTALSGGQQLGPTKQIFTNPIQKQTEDYITGRFG